jgi:hypothetical protein
MTNVIVLKERQRAMSELALWRRVYNALERNVSPRVETLVHSDEFATMTAVIASTRQLAGSQLNAVTSRLWHLVNLPAGSDVQRLRAQVGALDRQVRRLTMQLDRDTSND